MCNSVICKHPAKALRHGQSDIGKHKTDALLGELVSRVCAQCLNMSLPKMTGIIQNPRDSCAPLMRYIGAWLFLSLKCKRVFVKRAGQKKHTTHRHRHGQILSFLSALWLNVALNCCLCWSSEPWELLLICLTWWLIYPQTQLVLSRAREEANWTWALSQSTSSSLFKVTVLKNCVFLSLKSVV